MKQMILETNRLYLREIEQSDYDSLSKILQDEEVMYAYEHAFSDKEVQEWLERQITRYHNDGFGLWAVILKENNKMIGQCGLTIQDCDNEKVVEIGYLFQKVYWHKGYATEAAIACKEYAFDKLNINEVFSIIRDTNIASQKVALRNNMEVRGSFIKHYYGMEMPHFIYSVMKNSSTEEKKGKDNDIIVCKAERKNVPNYRIK